ncbi:hypothetical protein AAFF_G00019700 [Aldrovandia affinis]|uniref:Uncharacterized protein n=1 Tax=Aldrovandia affinis TaxID=143900 RepID=A0AAD7S5X8_9TELE|nr:hypothetical protein AAFF_G00019700 [Aldrovandia affinis]
MATIVGSPEEQHRSDVSTASAFSSPPPPPTGPGSKDPCPTQDPAALISLLAASIYALPLRSDWLEGKDPFQEGRSKRLSVDLGFPKAG